MCFGREPGIKGYLCSHRWQANFSMSELFQVSFQLVFRASFPLSDACVSAVLNLCQKYNYACSKQGKILFILHWLAHWSNDAFWESCSRVPGKINWPLRWGSISAYRKLTFNCLGTYRPSGPVSLRKIGSTFIYLCAPSSWYCVYPIAGLRSYSL